jgi:hypothetical protein
VSWNIEKSWNLLNALGQEIGQGKGESLDLSEYNNGVYFLKLENTIIKIIKK